MNSIGTNVSQLTSSLNQTRAKMNDAFQKMTLGLSTAHSQEEPGIASRLERGAADLASGVQGLSSGGRSRIADPEGGGIPLTVTQSSAGSAMLSQAGTGGIINLLR